MHTNTHSFSFGAELAPGHVCLVHRGSCSFLLKAKHCSDAGAVGVVVVNGNGQKMVVMTGATKNMGYFGVHHFQHFQSKIGWLSNRNMSSLGASLTGDHLEIQQYGLILPVMMVSHSDGTNLLASDSRLTFPAISSLVVPEAKAPYSRYGGSRRIKPDLVLPGDGISSIAVGEECGFQQMKLGRNAGCG